MDSFGTLAGVISGLATMALLFKPFFGSFEEFGECIRYWFTPDIFSWFSGEGMDGFWAELKLAAWGISGLAVGFGVNALFAD